MFLIPCIASILKVILQNHRNIRSKINFELLLTERVPTDSQICNRICAHLWLDCSIQPVHQSGLWLTEMYQLRTLLFWIRLTTSRHVIKCHHLKLKDISWHLMTSGWQHSKWTFHDIWWYLVIFYHKWWYLVTFHDKTCRLSWYIMTFHDKSWNGFIWFREVSLKMLCKFCYIY